MLTVFFFNPQKSYQTETVKVARSRVGWEREKIAIHSPPHRTRAHIHTNRTDLDNWL